MARMSLKLLAVYLLALQVAAAEIQRHGITHISSKTSFPTNGPTTMIVSLVNNAPWHYSVDRVQVTHGAWVVQPRQSIAAAGTKPEPVRACVCVRVCTHISVCDSMHQHSYTHTCNNTPLHSYATRHIYTCTQCTYGTCDKVNKDRTYCDACDFVLCHCASSQLTTCGRLVQPSTNSTLSPTSLSPPLLRGTGRCKFERTLMAKFPL